VHTIGHAPVDEEPAPIDRRWVAGGSVAALGAGAAVLAGYPAVGLAIVGGLMTWVSVAASRRVRRWFDRRHDERTELWWDALLILIVVVAFAGLVLMALALPN